MMLKSVFAICLILAAVFGLFNAVSVVEAAQPVRAAGLGEFASASYDEADGPFATYALAKVVADLWNFYYSEALGLYAEVEERADGFYVVVKGL
jgi:hypothetical protein